MALCYTSSFVSSSDNGGNGNVLVIVSFIFSNSNTSISQKKHIYKKKRLFLSVILSRNVIIRNTGRGIVPVDFETRFGNVKRNVKMYYVNYENEAKAEL